MSIQIQAFPLPASPLPNLLISPFPNNPNTIHLCYLSPKNLQILDSQLFSPIQIFNENLNIHVLGFAVHFSQENNEESLVFRDIDNKIFISEGMFRFLRLGKREKVKVSTCKEALPTRNYFLGGELNYFPELNLAKRVFLVNVSNQIIRGIGFGRLGIETRPWLKSS